MIGKAFFVFFIFFIFILVAASFFYIKKNKKYALILQTIGVLGFGAFIVGLGYTMERPPVLQSVWFIPHVVAYMIGYVALGCAFVLGIIELFACRGIARNVTLKITQNLPIKCDVLVKLGTYALGFGLCLGALWAKKAWGQYWSWDIKETAALITWLIFLLYIHLQKHTKIKRKFLFLILIMGFLSLQLTWYGIKFLPMAQKSPHTFYDAH